MPDSGLVGTDLTGHSDRASSSGRLSVLLAVLSVSAAFTAFILVRRELACEARPETAVVWSVAVGLGAISVWCATRDFARARSHWTLAARALFVFGCFGLSCALLTITFVAPVPCMTVLL